MRMRAVVSLLLVLMTLAPWPALTPAAIAQVPGAPPAREVQPGEPQPGVPADEPPPPANYPGAAQIDTIPPDAIVLSLDGAIRQALANNLNIAVSRYNPMLADANVVLAATVFDPLLQGNANYAQNQSKSFFPTVGTLGNPITAINTNSDRTDSYGASWFDPLTSGGSYKITAATRKDNTVSGFQVPGSPTSEEKFQQFQSTWNVSVTQPLLKNFGRDANVWQITVAQKNQDISESAFRQSVIDTVTASIKAYTDLDFTILQLRTARVSLKLAQDFLDENRIKVRVGTLAPIEITQAEAQVADREESVIIFEAALRAAEDAVRTAIGMRKDSPDWARPVRPSDPLTLKEYAPTEEDAMQAAVANRPDLMQARLNVEAREATLKARQNQRRWGLDLSGGYGNLGFDPNTYNDSIQDLQAQNQTNWNAGLLLSVPIGNRLALANYNHAQADLEQSRFVMQQVEQGVRLDVRAAVRQVETTLKRVKSAQTNVRLQREKLAAEQKKFENGMSTSFQVLSFQNDLSNAETRQNLATADYNKALADVERAKGTILDYFGILLEGDQSQMKGAGGSASLRRLWTRPIDFVSDPGLRTADRTPEAVRLPTDFVFVDGRAESRSASAVVSDWLPKGTGAIGGR